MERRDFLKTLGLFSGTLVTSWSFQFGQDRLVSQLDRPDPGVIPGEPVYYFSTCTECPAHCGLMVNVRDGHPVKLEGNPDHPVSRGALCIRGQASLVRLYHPERVRQPLRRGADGRYQPVSWDEAIESVRKSAGHRPVGGAVERLPGRAHHRLAGGADRRVLRGARD